VLQLFKLFARLHQRWGSRGGKLLQRISAADKQPPAQITIENSFDDRPFTGQRTFISPEESA
jgi:hypothetical protein